MQQSVFAEQDRAGTPRAEGYFVPTPHGADVFVRVALPRGRWIISGILPLVAVPFLPDLLPAFVLVLLLPAAMAVAVHGEGVAIRRMLVRLLRT